MDQLGNRFTRDVVRAIKKRMQILLNTCPLQSLKENYEVVNNSKILVEIFKDTQSEQRKKFYGNLLIAGTRLWEQYRSNQYRQPIFQFRAQNLVQPQLKIVELIFDEVPVIVPFPHQNLIQEAKDNILANLATFNILAQEVLTAQDIDQFFDQTQIKGFYSNSDLTGLSAFDGSIIYINLRITDIEKLKGTLHHEVGHYLPRSRMVYPNPRRISCENNPLQVINSQQAEAGYFVEYWFLEYWLLLSIPLALDYNDILICQKQYQFQL